jgi:hypothetical protein
LDTEKWLNWNGQLDNSGENEDNYAVEDKSHTQQHNVMKDVEFQEQQDVSVASSVPRLVWPTWKSKRLAENVLEMVNAIETRRNQGVKKK